MKRTALVLSLSAFLIAVIALLFVFQLHPLQGFYVLGKTSQAVTGQDEAPYHDATVAQIEEIDTALKLYKLDNGNFPETDKGLTALLYPTAYIEGTRPPLDGWGNDFVYSGPDELGGDGYEVVSLGADGSFQTEDDIVSFLGSSK